MEINSSESILQRVIDLLPTRVFWKDVNLVYLGCNEVFARDAGKNSIAEVVGKTDFDMGWSAQADLYRSDDLAVIQTGNGKINFEEPQTTPSGDAIWLRTSKVRLTDREGKVIGVLGMYDDITEQKNAENEFRRRTESLQTFHDVSLERELKMTELKATIKSLEHKLEEFRKQ